MKKPQRLITRFSGESSFKCERTTRSSLPLLYSYIWTSIFLLTFIQQSLSFWFQWFGLLYWGTIILECSMLPYSSSGESPSSLSSITSSFSSSSSFLLFLLFVCFFSPFLLFFFSSILSLLYSTVLNSTTFYRNSTLINDYLKMQIYKKKRKRLVEILFYLQMHHNNMSNHGIWARKRSIEGF